MVPWKYPLVELLKSDLWLQLHSIYAHTQLNSVYRFSKGKQDGIVQYVNILLISMSLNKENFFPFCLMTPIENLIFTEIHKRNNMWKDYKYLKMQNMSQLIKEYGLKLSNFIYIIRWERNVYVKNFFTIVI